MAVTKKKRLFGAGVDWIAELSKLFDEGRYSTAAISTTSTAVAQVHR